MISRRSVLKRMGLSAGLVLSAPLVAYSFKAEVMGNETEGPLDGGVYLAIDLEGTVHITIHRVEMGQGSRTGLPMIIADELEADWQRVQFHQSIGHEKYGDQNTDGSTSIRKFYTIFRKAGAAARMLLEQAAADHWGLAVSAVKAKKHRIFNLKTGASADFSEFVAAAAKFKPIEDSAIVLKQRQDFTYIGKNLPIIDMDKILAGTAIYGQDVRQEGMVYAVIARPPVPGGVLLSYDDSKARQVAGVIEIMPLPKGKFPDGFNPLGGVAVIASHTWAALKARESLSLKWDHGPNAKHNSASYEKELWGLLDKPFKVHLKRGDAKADLALANKRFKAEYFVPYQAHAAMEPVAATAQWFEDQSVTVWACVQDPQSTRNKIAEFMQVDKSAVTVHPTLLGGAFGRKSKMDFVIEAAWLAKQLKKPVKVIWSREDDMRHDYYHALSVQRLEAAINKDRQVTAWRHSIAFPPIGGTFNSKAIGPGSLALGPLETPFAILNMLIDAGASKTYTRVGWLRSVSNIQHAFAIGSFVDELAHKTGIDPLAMWLQLIGKDRHINPADDGAKYSNYGMSLETHPIDTARLKAVLNKAADMADWGRTLPTERGLGISVHRSFVSYVATAVEVSVHKGQLQVHHGWTAIDCGQAVNTDRITAQMEGAMIFAMTLALQGEITIKAGATVEGNFDQYHLIRMQQAPEVSVHIMAIDAAPGGVGEPGVPPVAPALMNAVFAATGQRIRRLPLGKQLNLRKLT